MLNITAGLLIGTIEWHVLAAFLHHFIVKVHVEYHSEHKKKDSSYMWLFDI